MAVQAVNNDNDDAIVGNVDGFIKLLESGVLERQWIKDRLAVIKSNEDYRAGKGNRIILDASES